MMEIDRDSQPSVKTGFTLNRHRKALYLIIVAVCLALVLVAAVLFLLTGTNEFEPLAQHLSDHAEEKLAENFNKQSHDEFVVMRDEYEKQTKGRQVNLKTKYLYNSALKAFENADKAFWKTQVKPEGEDLITEMKTIWLEYKEEPARRIQRNREIFDDKCSWWIVKEYNAIRHDDQGDFHEGVKEFVPEFVLQANRFDKVVGAVRRPYMTGKRLK